MTINDENVRLLRQRYNKIRRWVIADFLKRSARRYLEKLLWCSTLRMLKGCLNCLDSLCV
ncbi:MAG: hypothetical protein QXO16_04605 [Archaeoglobaceae archaeon]